MHDHAGHIGRPEIHLTRAGLALAALCAIMGPGCQTGTGGDDRSDRSVDSARIVSINLTVNEMMIDLGRTNASHSVIRPQAGVVGMARIENHTDLTDASFAPYAAELRQAFTSFANQQFIPISSDPGGWGDGRTQLHVSVMPIGGTTPRCWLVNARLTGLNAQGSPAVLWEDSGQILAP